MRGPGVAVMVAAAAAVSCVGASAAYPGLSWCAVSTPQVMKITKAMKPELSLIQVVVNNTLAQDVVDEVILRQQTPCQGINIHTEAPLDGEAAKLEMQDDSINLYWRQPNTLPISQKIDDFCITAISDSPEGQWTGFRAKFCSPNPRLEMESEAKSCSDNVCLRKCCPPGTSLTRGLMCAPASDGVGWRPSLEFGEPGHEPASTHMLYGPPRSCPDALLYQEFTIQSTGRVKLSETLSADVHRYCIDTFDDPSKAIALVCKEDVTAWHCEWKYVVLKPVLLGISAVCLIFVWLVYVSVARLRSLNEGRCLLSLVSALFVAYVTLIFINFTVKGEISLSCEVAGRLCHFALLASYFWMNVLSFHTYKQLKLQLDGKWEKPLVFGLYSLYAWGCPLVLVLVGGVLDAVDAEFAIRPRMDVNCWFYNEHAIWLYLYGPMVALLLVNSGFFIGCVMQLASGRRSVTFTPSASQHHAFSAWVYVRMFILMGILWLTEATTWYFVPYCSIAEWIFDIINGLQGVLVFLVTICCRKDLKVFHCGRPQLVQQGRHSEVTSTTGDGSEMAANPLVK